MASIFPKAAAAPAEVEREVAAHERFGRAPRAPEQRLDPRLERLDLGTVVLGPGQPLIQDLVVVADAVLLVATELETLGLQ